VQIGYSIPWARKRDLFLYSPRTTPRGKKEAYLTNSQLPNSITGDLDSLRPDVRAFYESRGVEVSQDADQDSTDFAKCLRYIATHDPPDSFVTPSTVEASLSAEGVRVEHPKMTVIALGGFGGRVDQSFHSVSSPQVRGVQQRTDS